VFRVICSPSRAAKNQAGGAVKLIILKKNINLLKQLLDFVQFSTKYTNRYKLKFMRQQKTDVFAN
jgi:hypothetical protein